MDTYIYSTYIYTNDDGIVVLTYGGCRKQQQARQQQGAPNVFEFVNQFVDFINSETRTSIIDSIFQRVANNIMFASFW